MTKDFKYSRVISRRDSLRACIVPAAAALTGRFLPGCSAANSGSDMLTDTSGAATTPSSTAANSGKSATPIGTAANSGSSAAAGAKSTTSAAGSSAATSVSGTAGSTAAPSGSAATAGSGALAQAGSPATGGAPATGAAGAGTQAGAAGATGAAGAAASGGTVTGMADASVMWATGGTAKLAKSYEDPFAKSPGTSCKLYPSQTLGPCYADKPMMRSDISDGLDGLPVRLSFLVVDKSCKPVPNATVDIWHSGSQGIYSAYAMGTTCNPGTDNVLMKTFCRGVQPLDETGRANFSTVFPGWYTGRTIHIHFTLRVGGKEAVTSQLYFEDALVDEILAQGSYKARGKRDTTNTRDMLFSSGNATPDEVLMEHVKRPDGVLHAWKVLSIG
jgi:protocatechuate 3,4-dioxygenase beta subunit